MKNIKFLLCLLLPLQAFAQTGLLFKTPFFRAEGNWVVLPNKNVEKYYTFGFIYLDEQAGFTMDYGGKFSIDPTGKFVLDTTDVTKKNIGSLKIRLDENTVDVSILKDEKLVELGLKKVPDWLSAYTKMEDRPVSLVARGYWFNHVGGSDLAIPYLEEAYKLDPETKGLGFEISFAYNATNDYKSAEEVLTYYLEKDPTNLLLYKEQVYALANLNKMDEAEKVCYKSFDVSEDKSFRSEMAFNIAQQYYLKKDKAKFDEWAKITKKYCPKESKEMLDYLDKMAKKLG